MRHRRGNILLSVATLALGGAALICGRADAVPLSLTEGAHTAVATTSPVDHVACWRWGWHGWGWYPFCGGPPPAVVYEEAPYGPPCRDVTERIRRGHEVVVRHTRECD